jgi:hypothetical protein
MSKAIVILWPSFLFGGVAEVVFFTVIDPAQLYLFGKPIELGALPTYSIGFLLFWALAAASSAFTCLLLYGADEINGRTDKPAAEPQSGR